MSTSSTSTFPLTCPIPIQQYPSVVMAHGGGGRLMHQLIEKMFVATFGSDTLRTRHDSAHLDLPTARLAFTTDSYVVRPIFFPGGDIGKLAVYGTVNDLAMSGARPLYLTASFIVEEGMPLDQLGAIATTMGAAAQRAGVALVTGDTKVVDRGHGDGVFISTTGVGLVPAGVQIGPDRARPGDVVIVSGEIGVHGVAILSVREGLEFGAPIESDTAPLHELVATLLEHGCTIHALRDPTRGGVASTLNEIAAASQVGIRLDERALPVSALVRAACEILGMDPIYVANEGKLVAIVAREDAERTLELLRAQPLGARAAIIGEITAEHPGVVVARTGIGGTRVVDMQVGEQLPRIC